MSATILKATALANLRFKKQCSLVATEAGAFNADVLGATDKCIYEFEVKVSLTDLKADFNKPKHVFYNNTDPEQLYKLLHGDEPSVNDFQKKRYERSIEYNLRSVPHYFYFLVPYELLADAVRYLHNNELAQKYGIAYVATNSRGSIYADGLSIEKRARKLHKQEVPKFVKDGILKRMSSELCNFHINNRYLVESNMRMKDLLDSYTKGAA